jgi:RNA-directed DNA polymerase
MYRIRTLLNKPDAPSIVWDADISKCFDSISHEFLSQEVPKYLYPKGSRLVLKWVKAGIIEKGVISIPKRGISQGGVISPLLCNITLNGLENVVRKGYPGHNAPIKLKLMGCWVIRYVDDFIITSSSKEKLEQEIILNVKEFLKLRGLEISEEKSKIVDLNEDSFQFLGWDLSLKNRNYRLNSSRGNKNNKILVIKPSKQSILRINSVVRQCS